MYNKIEFEEAKKLLDSSDTLLLDVRTEEEYITGHIANSILIPLDELSFRLQEIPDKSQTIIVYCKSGRRSELACEILVNSGYTNVYDLGGVVDWPYGLEM